jgi:hypothetical protein
MIRHHHCDPKVDLRPVIVQTAFEHNRTYKLRKNPTMISAERDEVLPVIALKMRKLPTIESLGHTWLNVGTAALGCPRSEAPLSVKV